MTNFYLYYNIFEKKNLQQLLFLTFNKDTFNDETLNIIKIMYHFKNFKIMFGQPFLDNPDAINIDMFNQNVISTHIVKQIDSKLANMKNENKYDENELNQIIELIKIFTHPEIGITRNEFISEYKNSLEERLLNKFNPKLCYSRPFGSAKIADCSIPIQAYLEQKNVFLPLAKALAKTNPNLKFFDPNMAFCNKEKCKFNFPTFSVYRDTSLHYSVQASIEVFDTFVKYAIINLNEIIN
jgi:hypothetical protein